MRVRRYGTVVALVLLLMAVMTSPSGSATFTIATLEYVLEEGKFGERHTLTGVYVHVFNSVIACANARNADDGQWAGILYCTGSETLRPLCGCKLRYGWVGAEPGFVALVNGHENY